MQSSGEASISIYSCGPAGKVESYNEAARRLWGGAPGDAPWCGTLRFLDEDGQPLPAADLPPCRAWREQATIPATPVVIETSAGARIRAEVRAELLRGGDGHPSGVAVLITGVENRPPSPLPFNRERFDALALHSPVATYIKDADGRYTQANPVACRYLGAEGDVVGLTDLELLPAEMAELLRKNDNEVIRRGHAIVSEEQVGPLRFLTSKFPLPDANGKLTQVGGISVEITERAKIERRLRESEERFRILTENAPVGIFLSDAEGRTLFVNRAWCLMAGMAAEDAMGNGWITAVHPDVRLQVIENWERAIKGRTPSSNEFPFLHPDGTVVWVQGSALPLVGGDGELTGYIGSCINVTEQRKADHLLQRQAARLRLLWEAAGVILSNERPDVMLQKLFEKIRPHLELNAFFSFMVDPTGDGLNLFSCSGISDAQKAELGRLHFGQAICGTVALRREPLVVTCIQQSDNEMASLVKGYGVSVYACNPLMAGGELLGTLSFASRTRTHFHPDEIEFLETITHSFTGAYMRWRLLEDLREADRKKDEFLATLAHELRNPLAPIRTGLEVMKMAGGIPAPLELVRATMERQMDQLVTLVNDLIDVSRITRGKLQLRLTECRLEDIVRSATEASLPGIVEAGHDLKVSVPEFAVHLHADPHRLAQVISNLLHNAAKYTPRGGTIRLTADIEEDILSVSVEDTGKGIPAGMLERIFEMFTQIDAPASGHGGLGIGLTLVKSLVQMHGGSVRAESAGPGMGCTFHLQLPVVAAVPAPAPPVAEELKDRSRSIKRVLIVDDNADAAKVLAMAVSYMGHEVALAENGQAALDLVPGFRPHVVFMDLGMPVMDGWEAARRMRALPDCESIHLVALTGWGQDGDRERTRAAGFDQHLVKPTDQETLRVLLESAT